MPRSKSSDGEYAASWQNHFYRFAHRLFIPPLVFYFSLFAFIVLINHWAAWLDGGLTWWQFDVRQLGFHIWFLVVFLAGDYFLSLSQKTLEKFRPSLDLSEKEYKRLTYRFINLPSSHGLVITLAAALGIPFIVQFGEAYQRQGLASFVLIISGLFMFSLVFALFYFLLRALRLTTQMYSKVTRVNIFHLDSLISFSTFTSRVGIFTAFTSVLSYITNVVISERPQVGGFLFFASLNLAIAIVAFVFPLLGFHERLKSEKEKAKAENNTRLELAQKRLHRLIDRNGKGIVETKTAISGLLELRHELDRISTWPWNTATLTTFISALILPVVIWLIQQFLFRLL
jgi:hypothetical protein